jgi:hypothetical protein
LRGLHRYSDARAILALLRPLAHDVELIGILNSEAACLRALGDPEGALALLDQNRASLEGHSVREPAVRDYTINLAQLLLRADRNDEASKLADLLAEAARQDDDPVQLAVALRVKLAATPSDSAAVNDPSGEEALVEALRRAFDRAAEAQGMSDVLLGVVLDLDRTLTRLGRTGEAEEVVRRALMTANPERNPQAWLLCWLGVRHALRRDDDQQAAKDAVIGLAFLETSLSAVTESEDAIGILAPHASELAELIGMIITVAVASSGLQPLARIAADMRNAPVLTARLRRSYALASPTRNVEAESTRLLRLLEETPAALAQIVELGSGLVVLHSRRNGAGRLESELADLDIIAADAGATIRRLDWFARQADPTADRLAFDGIEGWTELSASLRAAFGDVEASMPLCIVPGPLGSVPFSLALGGSHALSFAPSLGVLLALRERRRQLGPIGSWRPRRLFDFAVWRFGEKPAVAEALQNLVGDGEALAAQYRLEHRAASGEAGTAEALVEGLVWADLARIACHGRIMPEEEAIDLLVAAQGRLPPAASSALRRGRAEEHILGWRRLAALDDAPPIVISSACDSGGAILHAGGERLGLERPLLGAGTHAFIAPQWPVPAAAIQNVAANFLRDWLEDPRQSLCAVVAEERERCRATGIPALAAEAMAVFGDAL